MKKQKAVKKKESELITTNKIDWGLIHREMLSASDLMYRMWTEELNYAIRKRQQDVFKTLDHSLSEAVSEALCKWIVQETNVESLSKWLESGGWGEVDGDAVERRQVKAAHVLRHRAMDASAPRGEVSFSGELGAAYSAFYGIPRAEQYSPEAAEKVAAFLKELTATFLRFDAPASETCRPVLFGLDALKADFANRELWGLCGILPQEPSEGCLGIDPGPDGDWLILLVDAWLKDALKRIERSVDPSFSRELATAS